MMTRIRFCKLIVTILILHSCTVEDRYGLSDDVATYTLTVSVSRADIVTKRTPGTDDTVNNVKIFVFDKKGQLIHLESSASNLIQDVELPGKQKLTIYAVVNSSDDFSNVKRLDDLLTKRSDATKNDRDNLVMVGNIETTLTKNATIAIPVKRIAAKVVIEQLEYVVPGCDNSDTHYPTCIYLENVAADCPYSMVACTPSWCISSPFSCQISCYDGSITDFYYRMYKGEEWYYLENPAVLYAYPSYRTYTGYQPGLVLRFWGAWVEEINPKEHVQHNCYHWISFRLPDLESNTLYRIPKISINVGAYGAPNSEYSEYEIKAECRVETVDELSGRIKSSEIMEMTYGECFEIQ